MQFTDYVSDDPIIRHLCQVRINCAKTQRDSQDVTHFLGTRTIDRRASVINSLLPPRCKWAAFRPRNRNRIADVNLASLREATLVLRQSQPDLPWAMKLSRFIEGIRHRILSEPTFTFHVQRIKWELKEGTKYRALCSFPLEDNIINSLLARYLRDFCDPAFDNSSYAFRGRGEQGKTPTHHHAFDAIYTLKNGAPTRDLYVAECDIRGFYDTVDHQVALDAFESVVNQVHSFKPSLTLDPRAEQIFRAYLQCYTFPRNVLEDATPLLRREHPKGEFPWPEDALDKHHTNPRSEPIGVPQGGALSCIISNLVLDLADKRVRAVKERVPDQIHYFRYCDDMILLANREPHCQEAFQAYLNALDELKLPYHQPTSVHKYDKSFWAAKSKNPYCWTGRKEPGCVPWVQFVGYQVRYDGLVRIKKKSFKKQIRKLRNATDHVKFGLGCKPGNPGIAAPPSVPASKDQVKLSLLWTLVQSGVGKVSLKTSGQGPQPLCWAGGYKALHGKPLVPLMLKGLDRQREQQLRRMDQARIAYGQGTASQHGRKSKRPKPIRYPFSYMAQFCNAGGQHLVNNPYRPWFERFVAHPLFLLGHHKILKEARRKVLGWLRRLDPQQAFPVDE